ncbi:hypothetical protein [Brevibacterium zhoupengii]|uniref:hypothetical protein n=1 Tax=Brevibacterium zhoupengii TaxID=2898795 RepID=UPI001E65BE67|nr:hypothetical protein [Brevibacterium zhoupengii]
MPDNGSSHSSVVFAASTFELSLEEFSYQRFLAQPEYAHGFDCAIVTTVTSDLDEIPNEALADVFETLNTHELRFLVDDAYGARVRTVFRGGPRSLSIGADVVVTNGDKVGLGGPRCGILAGEPKLVNAVATWISEAGADARGPIHVALDRAFRNWSPERLRRDAEYGKLLSELLSMRLPFGMVESGLLGPTITADAAFEYCAGGSRSRSLSPVEITASIGMILLENGIMTVNALAGPGAKTSLRFKPTGSFQLPMSSVASKIVLAIDTVRDHSRDNEWIERTLVG